jgi:hypothetical protein
MGKSVNRPAWPGPKSPIVAAAGWWICDVGKSRNGAHGRTRRRCGRGRGTRGRASRAPGLGGMCLAGLVHVEKGKSHQIRGVSYPCPRVGLWGGHVDVHMNCENTVDREDGVIMEAQVRAGEILGACAAAHIRACSQGRGASTSVRQAQGYTAEVG